MKRIFLMGCFCCLWMFGKTQTITIIDSETQEALELVTLLSEKPSAFATTDKNGQADVSVFKGADKIAIRMLGYKTEVKSYAALESMDFQFSLILMGVSLNEVVISASKFEEHQTDVVQPVQVLRGSAIKQMNQSSMADVMANSGHVMVQKSQLGGGSPIIRGFETNKVLMVVDGVRLNNAIYRGGHLQNIITLDNAVTDRVEIIYGPGSVVYGSDALGGVMHFFTKNPVLSQNDSSLVKASAYARYFSAASGSSAHADVSVANKKWGSLSAISYSNFGDLRQGANRNPFYEDFGKRPWYVRRVDNKDSLMVNNDPNLQVSSGYKQYDFMQKVMYKASEKTSHLLNFQYSSSSDIPRYDRLTQTSGDQPKYGDWYYGPQKRLFASYNLLLGHGRFYDHAKIIGGYQHIEESRNTRRYQKSLLQQQLEELDIFTLNADFDKTFGSQELRFGAEAYLNKVYSSANDLNIDTGTSAPGETRYPSGGSQMHSVALYATHTWEINEHFILNDGLRATYIGLKANFGDKSFFPFPFDEVKQDNSALNGHLGMIWKPGMDWRLTANLSSGFRAPNVDDVGKVFESVPGSVVVPNPNLQPEFTYNAELGASKRLNKRVDLSALAYYTIYKNALTVQASQYQGQDSIWYDGQLSRVTSTSNAGEAYLYGFEARVNGNLNELFSLNASLNYTYGRIKTDSSDYPLDHIPPVFGKLGFMANSQKWRSEFYIQYSAWKHLEDYNINGEDNIASATELGMPAWYTLNLRLGYELSENIGLQLACENILDQNYRVFASNISAPGRNFILTLRGSF